MTFVSFQKNVFTLDLTDFPAANKAVLINPLVGRDDLDGFGRQSASCFNHASRLLYPLGEDVVGEIGALAERQNFLSIWHLLHSRPNITVTHKFTLFFFKLLRDRKTLAGGLCLRALFHLKLWCWFESTFQGQWQALHCVWLPLHFLVV